MTDYMPFMLLGISSAIGLVAWAVNRVLSDVAQIKATLNAHIIEETRDITELNNQRLKSLGSEVSKVLLQTLNCLIGASVAPFPNNSVCLEVIKADDFAILNAALTSA